MRTKIIAGGIVSAGILITAAVIGFALILFSFTHARAKDFSQAESGNTAAVTFISSTTSNKTSATQFLEGFSTHTFQITTLCTNACSNIISGSLDGDSWIPLATNSVSASATNGVLMIGYRFSFLRATFGQTTALGSTNTVKYLGSRQ